jgi:hypothetical protein
MSFYLFFTTVLCYPTFLFRLYNSVSLLSKAGFAIIPSQFLSNFSKEFYHWLLVGHNETQQGNKDR